MTDAELALFLLSACTVLGSYLVHPRLLEDSTHPLWTRITTELCSVYPSHLWPTAQWRIYRSSTDRNPSLGAKDTTPKDQSEDFLDENFDDNSAGNTTITDSSSLQVITDFAVVMPIFKPCKLHFPDDPTIGILEALRRSLKPSWSPYHWYDYVRHMRLQSLVAPVIIELKCPMHRSAQNVKTYCKNIYDNIVDGREQVKRQALCLFSSPKYAAQNNVIALAGAGEWWSFSVLSRSHLQSEFEFFSERDYRLRMTAIDLKIETIPEELLGKLVSMADVPASARKLMEAVEERESCLSQEAINRPNNPIEFTASGYKDFINATLGPYFNDHELITFSDYVHHGLCPELYRSPFQIQLTREDMPAYESLVDSTWSPMLRLGTEASNIYMERIKDELKKAAINEFF